MTVPVFFRLFLIGLVAFQATAIGGDKSRAPTTAKPSGFPGKIEPEKQTESHTCGLHAMESIYRSYGLTVDDFNLRERLGVDRSTIPYATETRGTIQPDILRVLDQDGFTYTVVDLSRNDVGTTVSEHLQSGHYALTLIKRTESGILHWIVLSKVAETNFEIVDSLEPEAYFEPLDFLNTNAVGVVLVQPRDDSEEIGATKSHKTGLAEAIRSLFR